MLLIPFVVVCLLKLYDKPNNGYVQKSLVFRFTWFVYILYVDNVYFTIYFFELYTYGIL